MKVLLPILATTAALSLGAATAKAADQCFFTRDIQNSVPSDDEQSLYLRVGVNTIYKMDFANQCTGISFQSNHISLQTVPGSPTICNPIDVDARVGDNGVATPCIVKDLHKLTPEEAAALPKKYRP